MAQKELTVLTGIEKELNEILNERENAIKSFSDMAESAKARIEKVTLEAETAFKATDDKAYHKALDEKRNNEDMRDMYLSKVDEIKNTPYISKEEYNQIVERITYAMDAYMGEQLKDYTKKIESLFAQEKEISQMVTYTNSLLSLAQKKLYKDPCGAKNVSGSFIPHPWKELRYKNTTLLGVLEELVRNKYNFELLSQNHDREEILGKERTVWG